MKVLVELTLDVEDKAYFLTSTIDRHLEDVREELELCLYDIDDIKIERIYLEEL